MADSFLSAIKRKAAQAQGFGEDLLNRGAEMGEDLYNKGMGYTPGVPEFMQRSNVDTMMDKGRGLLNQGMDRVGGLVDQGMGQIQGLVDEGMGEVEQLKREIESHPIVQEAIRMGQNTPGALEAAYDQAYNDIIGKKDPGFIERVRSVLGTNQQ